MDMSSFMDVSSMAMPDIASLSTYMARNETLQEIGTALLSNALNTQESIGNATVRMMEQSVDPTVGSNIDIRV